MKKAAEAPTGSAGEGRDHQVQPDTTRRRVARSILDNGASTATDLAQRLGLTPAAVRRHLDNLAEAQLVEWHEERVYGQRGRGRPRRMYSLTDAGRHAFFTAYDTLAVQAFEHLRRHGGDEAVTAFARDRAEAQGDRYVAALADVSAEDRGRRLAELLTRDGYSAGIRTGETASAGEQLCQHHCPVARVAEAYPALCEAETEMFARVLGRPVRRLATIAHGDGVCTTHVTAADLVPRDGPDTAVPATPETTSPPTATTAPRRSRR